jgi:hypothetical protein
MQNMNYYKDTAFQEKVMFYVTKAAIAVMAEEVITEHHALRVDFAIRVLKGSFSINAYALGVMANSTIKGKIDSGSSYDDDIEFTVNSLFTAFSGGANVT